MYDELVKALRICEDGEHCDLCPKWDDKQNGGMNVCQTAICKEAADAIEELTGFVQEAERDRDEYRERLDKANDAIEELQATLCNWCAVCSEDKRDLSTCEIYESCRAKQLLKEEKEKND